MIEYQNSWQCFVQGIDFNQELIKQDILSSWKRCKDNDVSLYDFDVKVLMNPKEKKRYVLKYLPEYQDESYQEFCNIVDNLKFNISIYDYNAKLKYIVNYDDVFDELYPKVGYFLDVSENKIGTNSTCLAILENKPFMVVGQNHYKYIFHEFSCAAVPFYDSNNKLSGTINASFINAAVNNDTLNIIYSLARLYEMLILKKIPGHKNQDNQEKSSKQIQEFFTFDQILGESEDINQAKNISKKAARVSAPILIHGDTGSGKEVFAQAIHNESQRRNKPFVAINCGAIPQDLIESELFGYEAGTFTGANKKGKQGLLEYASGGTLFLDEVESMTQAVQVKLLRVLSSSSVTRIGGFQPIPIDIRVISATKMNLEEEIRKGNFREDLYYRINVIQVDIPPLCDRKNDIQSITNYYIKEFSHKNQITIHHVEEDFLKYLEVYHWPGNVRELLNVIERSLVLSENGIIDASLLPSYIKESFTMAKLKKDFNRVFENPPPKGKKLLHIAEEVIIKRVLKEEKNNLSRTAERLGMSRPTLYKKINNYKSKE